MKKSNIMKMRQVEVEVKGEKITYDECYLEDIETCEELFDRNIEIDNDIRLYDSYKRKNKLLTSDQIATLRKKYKMNQKVFALSLGLGEVTIHRFENGSIQSEAIDSIIRLSENPDNMYSLILKNKYNLLEDIFNENINVVNELINLTPDKDPWNKLIKIQ